MHLAHRDLIREQQGCYLALWFCDSFHERNKVKERYCRAYLHNLTVAAACQPAAVSIRTNEAAVCMKQRFKYNVLSFALLHGVVGSALLSGFGVNRQRSCLPGLRTNQNRVQPPNLYALLQATPCTPCTLD
jgi:hypothetical protein